jgi:hypothetical protein
MYKNKERLPWDLLIYREQYYIDLLKLVQN